MKLDLQERNRLVKLIKKELIKNIDNDDILCVFETTIPKRLDKKITGDVTDNWTSMCAYDKEVIRLIKKVKKELPNFLNQCINSEEDVQ